MQPEIISHKKIHFHNSSFCASFAFWTVVGSALSWAWGWVWGGL